MGLRAILLLLLALLVPCLAAAGEVVVTATIEPSSIEVTDGALLSVTVSGAKGIDGGPEIPAVAGLRVQSRGTSRNMSIVNGRVSQSIIFQYGLFPEAAGSYTVGPIAVRIGKETYTTRQVTLSVVKQGGTPGPPAPGGPGEGEGAFDNALYVRASVDRDRVVLGQQVTLRIQFFQRSDVRLLEQPGYAPPETRGFWREDLGPQRTGSRTVQGASYDVTELVYALFPTQTGSLEISPATITPTLAVRGRRRDPFDLFGGMMGGEPRQVQLRTRPIKVQVDPLPEPKPADFTGGVGSYRLSASLDRPQVPQNEPITLSLALEGAGNASAIGDPRLPELVGFRTFPPTAETSASVDGDVARGAKRWKVVLVPTTTGRLTIPEVTVSIYDPAAKRYQRLAAGPFAVVATAAGTVDAGGGSSEVARVGRDLRTIRESTRLGRATPPPWSRAGFWVLQIVPLGFLAAALAFRRRLERDAGDRAGMRSRRAPSRFRRELDALAREAGAAPPAEGWRRLGDAVERYFTEKFDLPLRGRTREELAGTLRSAGVGEESVAAACALLDRLDFALFAPSSATLEGLNEAIEEAGRVSDRIEELRPRSARGKARGRILLLAGLALGAAAGGRCLAMDEARSRQLFEQANAAYRSGDYAEAFGLYREVQEAGWTSPDLCLNLGDAAYRAGQLGHAVVAFERGVRLAPTDPDLRANLQFALASTRDRQPEAGGSAVLQALSALEDRFPLSTSSRALCVVWWIVAIGLSLKIVFQPRGRLATLLGIVLPCLLVATAAWTGIGALREAARPNGVVVADELPVRSNPDAAGTVEFTLHAGTLVRLGRVVPGHIEVLFSDRLRGWAGSEGLVRLDAGTGP